MYFVSSVVLSATPDQVVFQSLYVINSPDWLRLYTFLYKSISPTSTIKFSASNFLGVSNQVSVDGVSSIKPFQ